MLYECIHRLKPAFRQARKTPTQRAHGPRSSCSCRGTMECKAKIRSLSSDEKCCFRGARARHHKARPGAVRSSHDAGPSEGAHIVQRRQGLQSLDPSFMQAPRTAPKNRKRKAWTPLSCRNKTHMQCCIVQNDAWHAAMHKLQVENRRLRPILQTAVQARSVFSARLWIFDADIME